MMKGTELQRAEGATADRDTLIGELEDMVHQDFEFLRRSRVEGFDTRTSMRIALIPGVDDGGKPVIAAEGSTEDLPDALFPKLAYGFSVRFQAVPRETEGSPELGGPSALPAGPSDADLSVPAGGGE